MRLRAGILCGVLPGLLLATLTACGGDGNNEKPSATNTRLGTPSAKVTQTVIDCDEYDDTAQKIVEAQQELYAGSGGSTEALDELKAQMDGLKEGAPADVKEAIDELNDAFALVQKVVANPKDTASQQELSEMGPKLAEDGQTITTYIVSQCKK